ncbi:V-type proton ATPase subunit S1b [Gouania willdenowi]|uniref:V-type proton ATPase subunit S1-like n=1 Tax=Gouania willdenowi TaxID=441366 RepID=A0A8C5EPA8_GOUWI|nr:V-type proton ATPase subunit S1-like [Gouania willdenowi]
MAATVSCIPTRSTAFIALLFSLFTSGSATDQVPLLMWSNGSLPPPLAPPTAGHITSSEQLSAYFTSAFGPGPHTLLLFLQDKLSKDDFTAFGDVFGNRQDSAFKHLEAAVQSSSSSVTFPALRWSDSSSVPALLQETLGVSPLLVDVDSLPHLDISASANNLLLISLPYCTSVKKPCKEVLQENDETIGNVLSIMTSKDVPYTAIYTGLQPSRVIKEPSTVNQPAGRVLLQTVENDVKPPIMFNNTGTPCIMLWAQNISVSFSPSKWIDLSAQTPLLDGSMCNATNSLLVLGYSAGISLRLSMSQRFYPVSARNWFTLDTVELRMNGSTASFVGNRSIYAPVEYSFHCQSVTSLRDALLVQDSLDFNVSDWNLNFVDFQIQGFGLSNKTNFSYASDCAGFFTAGIWMGLVSSLLMLLIFVYGLHMIMQVNTMDRFDDPKGPSISVPQTE